jgi:glycogen operon protein
VNFVTAHDGFTLTDLVSYKQRHNQANGEDNRDGHGHNLSVNHGVEGPTDDSAILAQRARQKRVLLAVTLLSLGTPMLLGGDELGHTQHGNNNAYCQDNATTWLNWEQADAGLLRFVTSVLALRRQRRWLQSHDWWSSPGAAASPVATWFSMNADPMHADSWHQQPERALMLLLDAGADTMGDLDEALQADCLLLLNASPDAHQFMLPAGPWIGHLDTASGPLGNAMLGPQVTVSAGSLWVASRVPATGNIFSDYP